MARRSVRAPHLEPGHAAPVSARLAEYPAQDEPAEASAAQALAFKVRPAFRASFTCERVNKDAQCIPILPLALSFTAAIAVPNSEPGGPSMTATSP